MKERVFKKLPAIHQTDVLDKFFKNTIDQWFTEDNLIRTSGYIGRKDSGVYNPKTDFYLPEADFIRENYQLEPVLTTKNVETAEITNALFYDDVLRLLSIEGSNITDQNRLFKSKAYSWAPPIDIDKFINFENYYWYDNGPVKIEITAPLSAPIVVTTDVIGKASFTSSNGINFSNGMKVEFSGANITPITYLNKEFIVEGVGTSIQLIDVNSDDFNHTLPYMIPGSETEHLWDTDFWDEVVWAGTIIGEGTELSKRIDYITIKRGAINQNPWSRTNGWYHKDVLLQVTGKVTGTTFTKETLHPWDMGTDPYDSTKWDSSLDVLSETFSLDSLRQAKRPIIEFDNDLELYKYGLEGIGNVSVVSVEKFTTVQGATNPVIDEYTLKTGDTIIFLNDNLLNFNLWDTDSWDPGSHPSGTQTSPGPYADMPSGSSGDWDLTMGAGAEASGIIYTVAIAAGTGVCTLTETTIVKTDQKVFAKKGRYYLGREFYWTGTKWQVSQLKDMQNDEPLFQLYDSDKNKLDDVSVYSNSTFAGSKIFSYKTIFPGWKAAAVDTYIGKSLQYKEFGQTADIVFTNNFEDTIDNVIGYKYANQYDLSGTGTIPIDKMVSTFVNGWNPTDTYSKQRVRETFISSTDGAQEYTLSVIPTVDSTGYAEDIIVTIDGKVAKQSVTTRAYDYGIVSNILTFTTNKLIKENQVIDVRSTTDTIVNINDSHYYEIPNNLEANPDNLDVVEATSSELQGHFASIISSQNNIVGNEIGTNSYRDTAKDRSKGTKILQHESSLLPLMLLLSQQHQFNITSTIRYNQNEYETFKNKFLQKAEYYGTKTDTANISKFVDTVFEDMYSLRSNLKIFTETNAFAYGTNYKEQIEYPAFNITYIDLDEIVTSAQMDNREKIVYVYFVTPEDRSDGKSPVLLLRDIDYTIENTLNSLGVAVTRVTFKGAFATVERNSMIEFRIFENIQNSFVPLTPSMVGMHSVYFPQVLWDDTYIGASRKFILGHDGSRTLAFDDFRDDVLLELEVRIYNAIPDMFRQEYLPMISYYDLAPGKFRFLDFGSKLGHSRHEYNQLLKPILQRWGIEHNVDFITHRTYDESLPFTWNYSKELDKDGETVPGSWRGIYLHYYDTVNPHKRPWEMLGFGSRPSWWVATYGTDYSSTNTALWNDLEEGIIRNGPRENYTDQSYKDSPFRRKGLSTVLPVDHLGNLLDPVQAGIFTTGVIATMDTFGAADASRTAGTYNGVTGTTDAFGTVGTFNIVVDGTGAVTNVTVVTGGTGHNVNDIITIADDDLGSGGAAAFTMDVATLTSLIIGGEYSVPHIVDRHQEWEIGDFGPAEYSAFINSIWPWVVNKILYMAEPAEYCTKAWDTINVNRTKANPKQLVFKDTNKRKQLKDFRFYSDTDIVYGYQSWIYSYLLGHGKTYKDVISDIFKTTGIALGYKVGGFVDKDVTVIADSYSTTRTSNSIFIPEENKTIALYNGYSEGLRDYSGVKIALTETGYTVSGYDSFNATFRIIPCIKDGPYDVVEVGNLRVNQYTSFYDVIAEVPYEFEYQTQQDVYNFLIEYGKYLKSIGFVFDTYDADVLDILDFEYSAKEFLYWAQMSTWDVGTFITVSPSASKIKLNTEQLGQIDNISEIINSTYSVVDKDNVAIQIKDLVVNRTTDSFTVSHINGVGIYGLKLNPYKVEHVILFDNITEFNDLIYDPLLRLRQDRLKLNLSKTTDWTGHFDAPGYIIQNDTIIPNFDTTANDYRKFFNVHDTPVTNTLLDSARHLIGYQQRDYLDNITEDENISFEFFQGMLRQKGNLNSINKLLRSTKLANNNMSIYEEYAFKVGEFGATTINTHNEIQIKSNDVRVQNPLIELTYEDSNIDVLIDDLIQINYTGDTRWVNKPTLPKTQVWPKLAIGYTSDTWLPTAGYVHNDDITFRAFDIKALASLNTAIQAITEPTIGGIAHVAKTYNDSFNVHKLIETELTVKNSQLLSTGKTRISVIGELIPTVTGNTQNITPTIGDTIEISLDGTTPVIVKLNSFDYETETPVMTVNVENANLIQKSDSIYVITDGQTEKTTHVVFNSTPPGPVTIIGQAFEPTVSETCVVKIDATTLTFTEGDTLSQSGAGASYTGGIIGNITNNVPNVTAFSNNGYLQITTLNNSIYFNAQDTLFDNDVGIINNQYFNDITINEVYNDIIASNIPDLFITKSETEKEILFTGEFANKIEVKKGIGNAFNALYFTDSLNNEITAIDNRVVTMDNVIRDINLAIPDEDFLASRDVNGNLQLTHNGSSMHVSGTALASLGLKSQTSVLGTDALESHPFNNNDVVILNNVLDKDKTLTNIAGGYVVEEQVVYVNKAIDIVSGVVTITDLNTSEVTTLTNASTIPIYDIVSADRDFIRDILITIVLPLSPNNIQVGDTTIPNSIFPSFTAVNETYSSTNIGPYTALVSGAGNVTVSTASASAFTSGSFTVAMTIEKKGVFVIDEYEPNTSTSSDKIKLWHSRKFKTKTEAFDNVRNNKSFYDLLDLVWVDNKPNGWLVGKLIDTKEHRGLSTIAISNGGNNYTSADIDKTFSFTTIVGETKVQPVCKIDNIRYGVDSINVTAGGLGYTTPPTVAFADGGEVTSAIAKAVLTSVISSITVTDAGAGYQNLPGVEVYESLVYTGKIWNVEHNLNQQYVNLELFDYLHKSIGPEYVAPVITYVDANNLTVDWNGVITTGYIDVIKSEYVSPLLTNSRMWSVPHNLGQQYVNVDIIYNDDKGATSRYSHPLIEYTDANNLTVVFPVDVEKSGRVAVTYSDNYVPGAAPGTGYTHSQTSASSTWTITHNLGKRHVNVDVAFPGTDIDMTGLGNWAVVQHNLGSQYVNIALIDASDNLVSNIYEQASIEYFSSTSLRITGGSTNIDKVSAIKPRFTSSLQSSANIWTITHSLNQDIANVDIIYDSNNTSATGRYDYPLIEYTDLNNIRVVFPTGVTKSGYAVVTHNDDNGASPGYGHEHSQSVAATTWNVAHNLGKKYVVVDVAMLGSNIDWGGKNVTFTVNHGLNKQYINVELVGSDEKLIHNTYDQAQVTHTDANNLTITYNGSAIINKIVVIDSDFVSSLQSTGNTWTITHSLGQDIANVDVIYNNNASARSSLDQPLIEYTDTNNVKVIFPTGVTKSGYVAVNNSVGASNSFVHTEATAATTWTVTHNLNNTYVNVDVAVLGSSIQSGDYSATIDSAKYYSISGLYDQPVITFVDANTLTITFTTATAGKAIISEGNTLTGSSGLYYNIKGLYDNPAIKYVDNNNLTITFPTAIAGKAIVSGGDTFSANSATKQYNIKGNYDFPTITHTSSNELTATFDTPRTGKVIVSAGKGIRDDDSVVAVHMEVGTDGGCVGMTINTAGTGYSVSDTILVTGGTGTTATGTVSSVGVGEVNSLTITNPGSGYTSAPTVTIDAPGSGTTATATCTVSGGVVDSITITLAGTGYTSVPNVVFSGGGGSSAVAVATIVPIGSVTGIAIANGGDYTVLPSHTNCATTASPATGRTGLTLDLLFKVKSLDVTISDSFQSAPDLKIAAPAYGGGGGCTPRQATATAAISGVVTSVEVLTAGEYATPPTIGFSGGAGAGAAATANLAGPVSAISIVKAGDITYLPSPLVNVPITNIDAIVGTGLTIDIGFDIITSFDTWFETHRAEEQRVNSALFEVATLYDINEEVVDARPLLLDFPKGVISGLADSEISYRLNRDPARYNITDDGSSLVNDDLLWDSKQIGHLWWDTSTVKFYNAEQGSNRYRRKYWNQLFPGSSVDMYEWVQSISVPLSYTGTGTVKSTTQYSQVEEWDNETNKFVTRYYFWVKNKTTIPNVDWRSRSTSDVVSYISNPKNLQWYAPISNHYERVDDIVVTSTSTLQTVSATGVDPSLITQVSLNGIIVKYTNGTVGSDGTITAVVLTTAPAINDLLQVVYRKPGGALIINGIDRHITTEDSHLQLEYKVKESEGNVHKQWILLRKNDSRSTIPPYFLNKMTDSLVGYDKTGLAIPDTSILHKERQYGTLYRPRQTWFKDVKLARKNFVILMNTILTTLSVNDNKTGWDIDVYNNQFITYVDWWETGYSTETVIKYTVDTIAKRKLLTGLLDGDIIKVKNDGTNRWRVYKYVLATETFLKIGAEKQTINFKTTTYTDTFTLVQSNDFRAIIDAIFNNVFTINWLVKTNEVFFGMISYVLSEQGDVDWIFKSSYLNISSAEDDVKQIPNFKVELLPHVQEYINEVKPYTSKVREYRGVKNLELETANSHITDFDNPPYYNSDTGKVQTLLTGVHPSYDLVLQTGIYKDYLDNHTDTNLLRASKVSLIFDRVDTNILQAKTYLTTGNVGVDSRTVHHKAEFTEEQRRRTAITDLNTRSTVGDLVADYASQRIIKYSSATSADLTALATMTLTVDDNIKNHPIIVANSLSGLTTITYDQLQGADTYYKIANGYHEDLTLTVHAAVQTYDYDTNAVLRTGQNASFDSTADAIDLGAGPRSEAGITIDNFTTEYSNLQRSLLQNVSSAFYDTSKIEIEDGERFDLTTFENDSPVPKEWGWDSQPWDYTVVENGFDKALVKWDQGQALSVMFSEFPNFAVEATAEYGNDRIGWHMYNSVTKTGVERVDYTEKFIYVTASGIPDHTSNWYDASWSHLDENNPNVILHQNVKWKIPGSVVVPISSDKENKPTGPAAVLRNGVVLYSSKKSDSFGNDDVWHYDAMYTAGSTAGYGPGTEKFEWRWRDDHGGSVDQHGQYHYYTNPTAIYNDNTHEHSPLLGYAFDGVPIYGPQGYASKSYTGDGTTTIFTGPSGPEYSVTEDSGGVTTIVRLLDDAHIKIVVDGVLQVAGTDFTYTGTATPVGNEKNQITFTSAPATDSVVLFTVTSTIQKMRSSYRLKTGTRVAIGTESAVPTGSYDGTYYEDYEYVAGLGDLDEHNGRIAYTPEKPSGMYAYYVTIDEDSLPVFPYVIGTKYYGKPEIANYETTPSPETDPDFPAGDPDNLGIPNLSIDRQDRDSKGHVRPTHEQWPDELIPISSKESLQITVQTNNHYTLSSVTASISFRIYYDADGETKYYALPNATKTTASAAITKLDTEISVTDVKVLPEPYMNSLGTGYTVPGVVFIGSERVEYLDIDIANNKLLHCRRGTGTTSVQDHAISTAIFSGDTNNILTYDTETTWDPAAYVDADYVDSDYTEYGIHFSDSPQAVFFKNRPGNALA